MKKKIIIIILFFLNFNISYSQELNPKIQVISVQIQVNDKTKFQVLEDELKNLMTSQKWTNENYEVNERINCSFTLTVLSVEGDYIKTDLLVVSSRPIYNSTYNTTLAYFYEKEIQFRFSDLDRLIYNEGVYSHNLVSILSFYTYIIIGLDSDSFQEFGGTKYYQKADDIVHYSQISGDTKWNATNSISADGNRLNLIKTLLRDDLSGFRKSNYIYHRMGLDKMLEGMAVSRTNIFNSIQNLKELYLKSGSNYALQSFFNAKYKEIVNIFMEGDLKEVETLILTLSKIDPIHLAEYQKLSKRF